MMTFPALVFGLLVATVYACIAHLIRGGNLFVLAVYILTSIAGFFIGNWLGESVTPHFLVIGRINFGLGSLVSFITLFIASALSHPMF